MPAGAVKAPVGERKDARRSATRKVAALARALAHPARIEIVRILARRRTCIGCDIVEEIGLAQSTTSEHLRILKAAGIIVGEIDPPRVCYSLHPRALRPLHAFLGTLIEDGAAQRRTPAGSRRNRRRPAGRGNNEAP